MHNTLPFDDLTQAEFRTKFWFCVAPASHSLSDALDPRYLWAAAHTRGGFAPFEEVTINHARAEWRVRLLVVSIDAETQSIRCRVLEKHDWAGAKLATGSLEKAEVDWGGPAHKYRVKLGDAILKHGFEKKEEAEGWIRERAGGEKIAA